MRSTLSRRLTALGAAVAGLLTVAGCTSSANGGANPNGLPTGKAAAVDTHGRLGVVAGENFWGNIAAQIGGDEVDVTSIITDPNADPHEYESSVTDAAAISRAAVVIENGVGYDDFMSRLTTASPDSSRTVLSAQQLVGVPADANPHLWYNPAYVFTVANAIERAFAAKLPSDAQFFETNLDTFVAAEQKVGSIIDEIRAKYAGTGIAYTERVPGYLVDAAGLKLVTPASFSQAIEDGDDPSPLDSASFAKALTSHTAKLLLYNSQVTDAVTKHLEDLARASGVPVVGVSETIPRGEKDFQSWQADQADAILAALSG